MGLTAILIAAVKELLLPVLEEQIAEAGAPTLITRADMDTRLAATGAYERLANKVALEMHPLPQQTGGEVPPAVVGDGGTDPGA